jgi:hypothetical protein
LTSGRLGTSIADSVDSGSSSYTAGSSDDALTKITVNNWFYVTYSVLLAAADKTTVTFYINNGSVGSADYDNRFVHEKFASGDTLYTSYIGTERNGGSSYNKHWNGFIYNFILFQKAHDTGDTNLTAFYNTGCRNNACWTCDFDKYADGSTCKDCDDSCTLGCRRCQSCPATNPDNFTYVHLCEDIECKSCTEYTGCIADKCGRFGSSKATNTAGDNCECKSGAARKFTKDDKNQQCAVCYSNCSSCDVGGLANYETCKSCSGAGINDFEPGSASFCG